MRANALKTDTEPQATEPAGDPWVLSVADRAVVRAKAVEGRLAFATLLLFFRKRGRFPRAPSEIDAANVTSVATQLREPVKPFDAADLNDRTLKRHRAEIRKLLGFREATVSDGEVLTDWLRDHAVADSREIVELTSALELRCREIQIEPPASDRIERIVRAALHAYDERFCGEIHGKLSPATRTRLDALLRPAATTQRVAANDDNDGPVPAVLMQLRADPGGPSVNSLRIPTMSAGDSG